MVNHQNPTAAEGAAIDHFDRMREVHVLTVPVMWALIELLMDEIKRLGECQGKA